MVAVAVAGGTGAVGRTIVKALVESNNHRFKSTAGTSSAQHLVLNYSDVDQIALVLRENGVETVVSALVLFDDSAAQAQINLIRGAAQSMTVAKFLPSEYHLNFYAPVEGIELQFKKFQLEAVEELKRHPRLTWSLIRNGLFLDYLGMPYHAKPTFMMSWSVFIDLQHETCVFPGDGTHITTFTHSSDLAAFIERLIGLPAKEWPRDSLIAPNKLKLNDLLQIVKQVTGRDFTVIYDSADSLHKGHITQLPSNKELFADPSWGEVYQFVEKEAMFTVLSNGYDLTGTNLLDLFPDIHDRSELHLLLQQGLRSAPLAPGRDDGDGPRLVGRCNELSSVLGSGLQAVGDKYGFNGHAAAVVRVNSSDLSASGASPMNDRFSIACLCPPSRCTTSVVLRPPPPPALARETAVRDL
nr:hypothetical protein CFP56_20663 [Quercus suber]